MSGKSILQCFLVALVVSMLMPALMVTPAQASDGPTNWAIVISGGANYWNNHARYWNDLSEMYEILTVTYGYDEDNVFVLYADGNPPEADPDIIPDATQDPLPVPDSGNCWDAAIDTHAYYPTDIIDYAATSANIDTVTDLIAASSHCGDTLFVFTTDHGGSGGTLNLWDESISAATFASHMNDITKYSWRAFEMEQCFSGEMIPDLSGPNTAIATAAGDTTSCGAGSSLFYYDPFVYYFNAALKGEFPSPAGGGTVDPSSWSNSDVTTADADGDGKVSFVEAYNYAYPLSTCDEDEQYDDNGDGVSQETGPMPAGGDGPLGALIFLGETFNQPPVADAGPDQTVERTSTAGAQVTLDGSGSYDCDNGPQPLSYSWTWAGGGSASGVNPTVVMPMGTTTVTLEVSDGELTDTDTVAITLQDTTPPVVTVEFPTANLSAQDGITLKASASDLSGVAALYFYIREPDGPQGKIIGPDFEDLLATLNLGTGKWEYTFDTLKLLDGNYVVLAKGVDNYSNEGWSAAMPFSIRNWAVIELLPSTPDSKAGRTMPVKFALRVAASVDPAQPFVYNDDLTIKIFATGNPGNILQTSTFGSGSRDYRIADNSHYITNFQTSKVPMHYTVEIWRTSKNFMVGSFTFKTVK